MSRPITNLLINTIKVVLHLKAVIALFFLFNSIDTIGQCVPSELSQFTSEIVARSSGNDLEAPLIPGEEIFVRISYHYDSDSTGRLLHGLIPSFGTGWNKGKIDFESFVPKYGLHFSTWVDDQDNCPPFTKKDIPTLCTFIDANGFLQLCNLECEQCPCTEGLKADAVLPPGWFWTFQPTSCLYSVECPLPKSWGPWGIYLSHNGNFMELDMLLTVDTFPDIDSCGNKELTIGIQEIFDDITGCWDSNEDRVNNKFFTQNWNIDCTQSPTNNKFNKLKINVYHDENIDGIRGDSEEILDGFHDYFLIGDSVSAYSQYLDYYLLTGSEYEIEYSAITAEDWILSTPELIDISFAEGEYEKVIEFGFHKLVSSISNQTTEKSILVYPNPVKSSLTIELPLEKFNLTLSNPEGIIIHRENVLSLTHTIDMAQFPAGIYFLSIYNEDSKEVSMQKIIKY